MKINRLLWYNKLNSVAIISAIIVITTFISATKDICPEVNKSIMAGDAQQLSKYLCSRVEMSVLGNEGYFSKVHAVSILSEFFRNNPPKDFIVKKGGSNSENTRFSIGIYSTSGSGGLFKIYYMVKKENDTEFVYKLTIEKKAN
jgi:hypothetical protein